jgi:hypothetical protein
LLLPAALAFPAPGRAAPAPATAVTAAGLVGRWGDNGDCAKYIVFRGDGTFLSYTGGEGRWSLSGGRLVMTGRNGRSTLAVARLDRSRIRIVNADGSAGISQRCPTPAR